MRCDQCGEECGIKPNLDEFAPYCAHCARWIPVTTAVIDAEGPGTVPRETDYLHTPAGTAQFVREVNWLERMLARSSER
jgi:hypothetical protein